MSRSHISDESKDALKTRTILALIIAASVLTFICGRLWLKYAAEDVRGKISNEASAVEMTP